MLVTMVISNDCFLHTFKIESHQNAAHFPSQAEILANLMLFLSTFTWALKLIGLGNQTMPTLL